MAGKRTDESGIDHGEAVVASRRRTGGGEGVTRGENEKFRTNEYDKPLIPERHENPARKAMRSRRDRAKSLGAEEQADLTVESSFPASDAPPGPRAPLRSGARREGKQGA
ncbi:MAG: hypothetical protein ACRENI_01620 [Gemmatimonadaceae bacterium]